MTLLTASRGRVKPSVVLAGPRPRRRPRWRRRLVLGLLLVGLVASGIGLTAPTPPPDRAAAAARRFLDTYVDPSGRVVRRDADADGDTVSDGQAHALLLSVALGDRATFERVWSWTAAHLQHPGALLARRWADGRVRDATPAASADIAAAHALLLAADRFDDPRHLAEGLRLADAVRAELADPGALDPRAFAAFEAASGQRWWADRRVADTMRLDAVLRDGTLTADGDLPDGTALRLASACHASARALAAALDPALAELAAQDPRAPVLVAAAAAAGAAGDPERRATLLDRAEAAEAAHPDHDGSAWVALGRVLLTTSDLGTC